MAIRIDKEVGKLPVQPSSLQLQSHLRRRAGRNPASVGFFGLKRAEALGDVDSPSESLQTILESISEILDTGEISLYGKYTAQDWSLTNDLVSSSITQQSLSNLVGASELEGPAVSTSPRIRIQDRVDFLDSFYGRGSWPGLASGPTAFFYRIPRSFVQELGYIKFTYDVSSLDVTVTELLDVDETTPITPSSLLGPEKRIVFELASYINPSTSEEVDLRGASISVSLESGGVWKLFSSASATSLNGLGDIFAFRFKIVRPYSQFNPPAWFTQSPNLANPAIPGGPDDLDPTTSFGILENQNGNFVPVSQKEYWYTGAYVPERWNFNERSFNNTIVQDSNIKFTAPPFPIRFEESNWGVRWDGYLRLQKRIGGPQQYIFQIQTNTLIKIDLAISKTEVGEPVWENVLDTFVANTRVSEESDLQYSDASFTIDNLSSRFIYYTNNELTEWDAYVPISIRMFYGEADKAYPTFFPPLQPDLFIKTLQKSSGTTEVFFGGLEIIQLSGTDGNWTVTSESIQKIISVLQTENLFASFSLIQAEDVNGQLQSLSPVVPVSLVTDGSVITSTTTGLEAKAYLLRIAPNVSNFGSITALWKSRITAPSPFHSAYADLTDGSFQPIIEKKALDEKPLWWKILQGGPFDRSQAPTLVNNPLEGVINNQFKPLLQSKVPGIGFYGDGLGNYSSVPNVILGEARFNSSEPLTSNYVGIRLSPNLLGEGGKLKIDAIPSNNATFSSPFLLGENDLGGAPNHLTSAISTSQIAQLFWSDLFGGEKFYLHSDLTVVTDSDNPEVLGLPPFNLGGGAGINPVWLGPISVIATELADNVTFTTNRRAFVAPLTLNVEKIEISAGVEALAFTPNFAPLLNGGSDFSGFNTKYVRFYTEPNLPFQFSRVDTGEGLSLSDALKLTYNNGVFISAFSEIPRPPADRVTPFGYDNPAIYSNGICYPPYVVTDPLLEDIAISDANLLTQPKGNYDVFWGDSEAADLGEHTLRLTEKLEFSITASVSQSAVIEPISSVVLQSSDYTHRLEVNLPLPAFYDPDVFEYIGNREKVTDRYFLFVKRQE
jgi:hypothetical protein